MKAKDTVRLSALRNAKKYIIEAKTSGPEIAELPDADVLKIVSKLAKQGTDSAAIFTEQNRPDLAQEELAQVAVYQEFLPRQLTPEELTAEVRAHNEQQHLHSVFFSFLPHWDSAQLHRRWFLLANKIL